jgi:hypothetical protein
VGLSQLIDVIRAGQPVAAGVVNLPIEEVQNNVLYLWQLIQAAGIGSTVVIPDAVVATTVVVGTPVYFNPATGQYEQAITGVSVDSFGGLVVADSAKVIGVVLSKSAANMAEILLYGFAPLDFSAAMEAGQTLKAGTWYLSAVTPGTLTALKPAATIPVLFAYANGSVFVRPQVDDFLNGHRHLHFKLKPRPAGETVDPGVGNPHTITSPNPNIEGWLTASHAMFNGNAPHGAKFGYTLWNNAALKQSWPPLPPDNAILLQNHTGVPSGPDGLVIFDRNGIWWMSDCYDTPPWATTLNTETSEPFSESAGECPYQYEFTQDLYFIQPAFFNDTTVVTSLTTTDKRVVITCQGGSTAASVGPLQISLDLSFLQDDVDPGGYLAIKAWDATNGILHRGPVTTGLYSQSGSVVLTSPLQTTEQVNPAPAAKTVLYHGPVGISVDNSQDREVFVQLVRLAGVEEQYFSDVMYLGFSSSKITWLRGRVSVPDTLGLTNPQLVIGLRILGRVVGALSQLVITGRRIPAAGATPTALPLADASITLTTVATLTAINQYVDFVSSPITVAAGDDFLFTITRNAPDGYSGELGILRISGILSPS